MFDLDGKVAVVFGGNGYLGRQLSKSLVERGAKTYICDINVAESKEINALEEKYRKKIQMIKVDATKQDELVKLKDLIFKQDKRVDILVNTATMTGKDTYLPFEESTLDGWNISLLGNLTIPYLTVHTFIPIMKKQRSGSIVNIASLYGIVANDQRIYIGANLNNVYLKEGKQKERIYSPASYAVAKAGLIHFTRYLAAYYGEYNIRANCISPGGIYNKNENEVFFKKYSDKVPLGRKANLDEMNGALIFLASNASSYVTGHNLVVDGGFTIW